MTAVLRRRLAPLVGLVAALVLVSARPAAAHTELAGSAPADGSVVPAAPTVVAIAFTEPASAAATRWRLSGPDGRPVADLALAVPVAGEAATFQVALPRDLADGTYALGWDGLVSDDGHAVAGRIRFSIGAATPGADAGPAGGATGDGLPAWWERATAAATSLWYAALSLTAGGLILLVWARRHRHTRPDTAALALAGRTVMWWGAVALSVLTAVRFGLVVAHFGGGTLHRTAWRAAVASRAGGMGLKALALTPAVLYAAAVARRDRRLTDTVPVAALLVGLGLLEVVAGHAGAASRPAPAVLFTAIHLFAMAAWLGPLLAVLLVPLAARGGWRALAATERRAARLGFLRDFAALGGSALGAVLVSGVVLAHDRTGWRFWDGGYGRTLTLKLLLVAVVIVPLAAHHRRHLARPDAAGAFVDGPRFRRTLGIEVVALIATVVAAAVLTGQDPTAAHARPGPEAPRAQPAQRVTTAVPITGADGGPAPKLPRNG